MLILKVIGIVLLSLLATLAFIIVAFGLLSRFTDWLYNHHAVEMVTIKKLLRLPIYDVAKNGDSPRYEGKCEVWCERCFDKAYDWVSGFIRKTKVKANRDCQGSRKSERCQTTVAIDFPYNRLPRILLLFPRTHIRNIIARLIARCQRKWKRTVHAAQTP
jgi:hypothetical protein